MSEKIREFVGVPQEFFQDGKQVCLMTSYSKVYNANPSPVHDSVHKAFKEGSVFLILPEILGLIQVLRLEFTQICRAVAVGFAVMGFIGYFVKLIHIPMCVT